MGTTVAPKIIIIIPKIGAPPKKNENSKNGEGVGAVDSLSSFSETKRH